MMGGAARVPAARAGPNCNHSIVCGLKGRFRPQRTGPRPVGPDHGLQILLSLCVSKGIGGVPSVALDSKGYLWVFKRSPEGVVQLMKFDPGHKLVLEVPESVIGHQAQKAHGMAVDKDDNVWITGQWPGETVMRELSTRGQAA